MHIFNTSRLAPYFAILLLVAVLLSGSLSSASPVFAADPPPNNNPPAGNGSVVPAAPASSAPKAQSTFTLSNPLKVTSIGGLVKNFVDIFSVVVIILAVLTLIWVGLQFILARGDVAKMKELREWLLWIIVGIAVVISARLIVDIVINTLSATGTVDANTLNTFKNVTAK
jgi:hypothetical protein